MNSGTTCGATMCAAGYVGTPGGSLSCYDGVVSGSFSGCTVPSACPADTVGYATDCGAHIASGATCSATACAPGYTGTAGGSLSCANGVITGKLRGCAVPVVQAAGRTCAVPSSPMYATSCGGQTVASGAACVATACAPGYIGTPSGTLSCADGVITGKLVGCSAPSGCTPPATPGYATDCGATMVSGATCAAQSCAYGYDGTPSGALSCTNGAITVSCALPTSCAIPSTTGYTVSCAATLSSCATCVATACAPGYAGTPLGVLSCSKGVLSGKLRGCALQATKRVCSPDTQNYTSTCAVMASGTKCSAQSCAHGYIGKPSGTLSCTDGAVKGALVGCSSPAPCSPPKTPVYATDCGATMTSGTTCGASACAFGFAGKPSGALSCTNGAITGAFAGCKKKNAAAPARRYRRAL